MNPDRDGIFAFGNKFGVREETIFPLAFYKNSGDRIFVGTDNFYDGFYTFLPEELDVEMSPLNIVITDFFFNSASRSKGKDSSFLMSANSKNDVSLDYNQNNFGLRYMVKDYYSPELIRYYTMIENYDPVWRQAGIEKVVYYFNLAPGDYIFRVRAYSSNEVKGEKTVRIHISPPWWKTGVAYTAYVLLLLAGIFVFAGMQKQRIIRNERHKTQEKELAQAKKIEKAYTELKATQAQLIQSEKMASLGELTAGIAHEIQNPLNFVNNFSEVNTELIDEMQHELKSGNSDEVIALSNDIRANQEKILMHGKRADSIVKGMLQHSRTSSGQKDPTDINALTDEYLRLSYHGLRTRDKDFNAGMKTEFDLSAGEIKIVSQEIGRVLLNIFNNAFYAVAEKKKLQPDGYEPVVTVSTKKSGNHVEIRVRDNGNGIPRKVTDKIFQPFFTTKPPGQGTGLGLSLSYDIVRAHGGEIKVDTKEGEYTIFTVSLPV